MGLVRAALSLQTFTSTLKSFVHAAVFIATSAIFIAQMAGMKLGVGEIVTVVLTTFAASLSSAPIPSAALVLLIMVLTAIDAPLQDVTLLFAIDWFV